MEPWASPSPRCGHPMQPRTDNEHNPRCDRPAGHTPNRHLSRTAYRNELARTRKNREKYPR